MTVLLPRAGAAGRVPSSARSRSGRCPDRAPSPGISPIPRTFARAQPDATLGRIHIEGRVCRGCRGGAVVVSRALGDLRTARCLMGRRAAAGAFAAFAAALAAGPVSPAVAAPDSRARATAPVGAPWQQGQRWIEASGLRAPHNAGITGVEVAIALIDGPVNADVPDLVGQDVRPTLSSCSEANDDKGPLSPSVPLGPVSLPTTSIASVMVGSGRRNGPGGKGILGVAPGATLRTYAIFNALDPAQNLMCDPGSMGGLVDRVVADGADVVEIPVSIETTLLSSQPSTGDWPGASPSSWAPATAGPPRSRCLQAPTPASSSSGRSVAAALSPPSHP